MQVDEEEVKKTNDQSKAENKEDDDESAIDLDEIMADL